MDVRGCGRAGGSSVAVRLRGVGMAMTVETVAGALGMVVDLLATLVTILAALAVVCAST